MAALAIGAAGCGGSDTASKNQKDKVYNVGILQLVEHPALDAANKGFVDGLAAKGFAEGKNVKFDRPERPRGPIQPSDHCPALCGQQR